MKPYRVDAACPHCKGTGEEWTSWPVEASYVTGEITREECGPTGEPCDSCEGTGLREPALARGMCPTCLDLTCTKESAACPDCAPVPLSQRPPAVWDPECPW